MKKDLRVTIRKVPHTQGRWGINDFDHDRPLLGCHSCDAEGMFEDYETAVKSVEYHGYILISDV